MAKIKITRKLLSSYRKLKKEIVVLELELVEMMEGDNGIGVSVVWTTGKVIRNRKRFLVLIGSCMIAVRRSWITRKHGARLWKIG